MIQLDGRVLRNWGWTGACTGTWKYSSMENEGVRRRRQLSRLRRIRIRGKLCAELCQCLVWMRGKTARGVKCV